MANKEDYAAMLPAANKLTKEQIKEPYIAIGIYVQEAEDLSHWCKDDQEKLAAAGLSESLLHDLPIRTGACREAQSIWVKDMQTKKEAEKRWADESPKAFDFRDQLLHSFKYAFRKDTNLLNRIANIDEGDNNADMIQDLNDLSALGKANTTLLNAVGFDITLLDSAAEQSDILASLLAEANGDRKSLNENKVLRDRMYSLLKEAVDEVRECGKYVFWKEKARSKGYASAYLKKLRTKKEN